MEVFDATVEGLTNEELIVILNNHNSKAGWCCSEQDGEGLWYTHDYPEEMWIEVKLNILFSNFGKMSALGSNIHGREIFWKLLGCRDRPQE